LSVVEVVYELIGAWEEDAAVADSVKVCFGVKLAVNSLLKNNMY
jgi:hypothetical protein